MTRYARLAGALLALALAPISPSAAAVPAPAVAAPAPSYADIADLALAAPVAAIVDVRRARALPRDLAAGVPPGRARLAIEADVVSLLSGAGGLPAHVEYLADVPLTPANRVPKLRKARMLLLAARVPDHPQALRLVSRDAQIPWTAEAEAQLRGVLKEAAAPAAPPRVAGIANAFHVPGSLPGESETQIFLRTADERPISLSVLRRPGEAPRWAVALGELVDDSAATPRPGTLLWYRLACGLPLALPDPALADLAEPDRAAVRADYAVVLGGLGPCGRTLR